MFAYKSRVFKFEIKGATDLVVFAILGVFISVGVFLSITSNYGSDNDTYGMLRTFINLIEGNGYVPSRFTGYPVSEVGIGFIAFYFGSWLNNLISFIFLIISLILIYVTLIGNTFGSKFFIFLTLAISNPVLFFDNLAPMDYSWSLLFFSLGLYFLKKENLLLSVLFFGISIGTRPNFLFFIIFSFLLFRNEKPLSVNQKISAIFVTTFFGSLFYVTIWFNSGLTLDWLTAGRPLGQGYFGLVSRFVYKSWMAVGLFVFPIIIFLLIKFWQQIKKINNFNLISSLILFNLLIYLYIPADRSYLQLGLILLFLLLANSNNFQVMIVVLLNVVSWFVLLNPFHFTFKSIDPCGNLEAISAKFDPSFSQGELFIYLIGQEESICYQDQFPGREIELNSGLRLKINK